MPYLLQMFGFSTVVVRKYFFGRCDPRGADGGEGAARGRAGAVFLRMDGREMDGGEGTARRRAGAVFLRISGRMDEGLIAGTWL